MRWFNAPRSLFYQLLLFFGLPLLASARTVAERLVVREGQLAVDVPYVVLDSFERNMNDQLYY